MTSLMGLILLAGSTLVLWLALCALVVARKARRDLRERRSTDRRSRYEACLRDGDHAALVEINREARSVDAQVDLAEAIDAAHVALSPARLAEIRDAAQESGLFPILVEELTARNPVIRARAALLLTRTGVPSVVDQIAPLLGDPDPDVQLVACSGLARIGTAAAAEALVWGLTTRALPAERIIERLAAPWAVETILHTLRSGPSSPPRLLAGVKPRGRPAALEASLARALGLAGDPRAELDLIGMLDSDSEEVRVSAARALGRAGRTGCVPALIATLESDFWPVRAQAAKSLGALGALAAMGPLVRCLSDSAWWVRGNAARALRDLGAPGIEALRRATHHADPYARDRAHEQLALQAVLERHPA
jgi:HEAT repeat protein